MSAPTTRASLLSRVRDPADQLAWREFESRYGDLIVRYARARRLQHADAEDVRQHVLLELSKSLRGFQYDPARGRFRDYLGRIVKNVISRVPARPNSSGGPQVTNSEVEASAAAESDILWEQEWVDHHYRRALQTIQEAFEPRSVAAFERILKGESIDAVAAAESLTPEAVHKAKQRIRDRLRQLIANQVREEDQPYAEPIEQRG
jgi:RNA polymerase sigma-70 factor (ECF subfamily)